jgi:hypothetical protein
LLRRKGLTFPSEGRRTCRNKVCAEELVTIHVSSEAVLDKRRFWRPLRASRDLDALLHLIPRNMITEQPEFLMLLA